MNTQRDVFENGEGDAWFARNAAALQRSYAAALADPASDPVIRRLLPHRPKQVLEIGAANGWRLDVMSRIWEARTFGIDPSRAAIEAGEDAFNFSSLMKAGTAADTIRWDECKFDCVIYGFCLYLCDRADLPKIVYEGDRVLKPGGLLVVYDFAPAVETTRPYHHRAGVTSFKRDHSLLWRAFGYELLEREDLAEEVAVVVLRKPHASGLRVPSLDVEDARAHRLEVGAALPQRV